ncbi:MAG: DUF2058 domain-containing protein [Methylococcaceae bacterium]|jgi:uncharacterized protein YaiL (DUF2058 family)
MAGLREQLLKSGLVNEKQVKKITRDKHKARLQGGIDDQELDRQKLQLANKEKSARDKELNHKCNLEIQARGLIAQIRQLIETQKISNTSGDLIFSFADNGKVKRLYVNESIRSQLTRGQVAIVRLEGNYELVPRETAARIQERDSKIVIHINDKPPSKTLDDASDPYAGYDVPDDLLW